MPTFAHRSLDQNGQSVTGQVRASTRAEVIEQLTQQGLTPVDVATGRLPVLAILQTPTDQLRRPAASDVYQFTRDLARLTKAGMPLDRALHLVARGAQNSRFNHITMAIQDRVRRGGSLAAALSEFDAVFSPMYVASVHAGEVSGRLPATLKTLESVLQRRLQFIAQVRSALIYPSILLVVVLATLFLVVVFVLPQFAPLFEQSGQTLPWLTRAVMGLASFLRSYGVALLGLLILAIFVIWGWLRVPERRMRVGQWTLRYRLLSQADLLSIVRTIGSALSGGVTLEKSLQLAVKTAVNPALAAGLSTVAADVRRGRSLSVALSDMDWTSETILQMVRLGEETGRLGPQLLDLADLLEEDYQTSLERRLGLIGPLVTLVMGAIVGVMVGGVLLGMLSISKAIY